MASLYESMASYKQSNKNVNIYWGFTIKNGETCFGINELKSTKYFIALCAIFDLPEVFVNIWLEVTISDHYRMCMSVPN